MGEFTVYSATGCARCKIVKGYMDAQGIAYVEKDMKAEGKEDFQKFYAANRNRIFRGPEGVEFPIVTDGTVIRQGVGACLAYLYAGTELDGFFSAGTLHKEWVDGINVAGGDPQAGEKFLAVVRLLKGNNFKLVVDTYGRNPALLEKLLAESLAEVVVMEVPPAAGVFERPPAQEEIAQSVALAMKAPEYRFQTTVYPVKDDGGTRYLTPQEVAAVARLLENTTQSKKNPYLIRLYRPAQPKDERLGGLAPMPAAALLPYRTQARAFQVLAEAEKE
jgi:pyruvate formate lyase activating enzyme